MTVASAPAKAILLGEHAVVYRQPALAIPLDPPRAEVEVSEADRDGITIISAGIGVRLSLLEAGPDEPLAKIVRSTLAALAAKPSGLEITVRSTIPIAAGLGSGAAVSIAIVRALSRHLGRELSPEIQSELAFEVEKTHHGTPSGIDNTVIAFGTPIRYQRDRPIQRLKVGQRLRLLIADSGIAASTAEAVARVRAGWEREPDEFQAYFEQIGALVERGQAALENGNLERLGELMDHNQQLLRRLGVSHDSLDRLIQGAKQAGALGAKLSGGGLGGVVLALTGGGDGDTIMRALEDSGATRVLEAGLDANLS